MEPNASTERRRFEPLSVPSPARDEGTAACSARLADARRRFEPMTAHRDARAEGALARRVRFASERRSLEPRAGLLRAMGAAATLGALVLTASCGPSTPPPAPPSGPTEPPADSTPKRSGVRVEAEIGALDERGVDRAFKRAGPKLIACFGEGARRIPFLAGSIRFAVRVTHTGETRWAYVKESTLGDRETEACMLEALKGIRWPEPVGGEDGLAETSFEFPAQTEEQQPVSWTAAELGTPLRRVAPVLSKCRSDAGAGRLEATVYVQTDGKPLAIGVAASDERGEAAIPCVLDTLREVTFPSPGSYAAKATFPIE